MAKWLSDHRSLRGAISVVVSFVFIFTVVLSDAWAAISPAGTPEVITNTADQDKYATLDASTFSIPAHMGDVKFSFKGTSNKVLIHIQDAHCNKFAQQKISDIIDYLNQEYGINVVNLEGGEGNYDLSLFAGIGGDNLRREVAEHFMETGDLNGAEFYAINNPGKVTLWGIENKALYLDNLSVYRESVKYKPIVEEHLKTLAYIFTNLKRQIYSRQLLQMDTAYTSYKAGTMEFRKYIEFLVKDAKERLIDVKKYPNVYLLSQAMEQEKSVDFNKADREREMLLDELRKGLSMNEATELVTKALAFRAKRVSQKDFYEYLLGKASEIKINTDRFPSLMGYIVYVSTYEAVDKYKVMEEVDALENEIKEQLYQNDTQRELNTLSKNMALLKNIFSISLTKVDYKYYLDNRGSFNMANFTRFIKKEAPKYKIDARPAGDVDDVDMYREKISKFYEYSFKRDDAFLSNMRINKVGGGRESAVIMTGGFHTENLCELFKKNDISYVSILPNFRSENNYESPYFGLLAGETAGVDLALQKFIAQAMAMALAVASHLTSLGTAVWGKYKNAKADILFEARVYLEVMARSTAEKVNIMGEDGKTIIAVIGKGTGEPVDMTISELVGRAITTASARETLGSAKEMELAGILARYRKATATETGIVAGKEVAAAPANRSAASLPAVRLIAAIGVLFALVVSKPQALLAMGAGYLDAAGVGFANPVVLVVAISVVLTVLAVLAKALATFNQLKASSVSSVPALEKETYDNKETIEAFIRGGITTVESLREMMAEGPSMMAEAQRITAEAEGKVEAKAEGAWKTLEEGWEGRPSFMAQMIAVTNEGVEAQAAETAISESMVDRISRGVDGLVTVAEGIVLSVAKGVQTALSKSAAEAKAGVLNRANMAYLNSMMKKAMPFMLVLLVFTVVGGVIPGLVDVAGAQTLAVATAGAAAAKEGGLQAGAPAMPGEQNWDAFTGWLQSHSGLLIGLGVVVVLAVIGLAWYSRRGAKETQESSASSSVGRTIVDTTEIRKRIEEEHPDWNPSQVINEMRRRAAKAREGAKLAVDESLSTTPDSSDLLVKQTEYNRSKSELTSLAREFGMEMTSQDFLDLDMHFGESYATRMKDFISKFGMMQDFNINGDVVRAYMKEMLNKNGGVNFGFYTDLQKIVTMLERAQAKNKDNVPAWILGNAVALFGQQHEHPSPGEMVDTVNGYIESFTKNGRVVAEKSLANNDAMGYLGLTMAEPGKKYAFAYSGKATVLYVIAGTDDALSFSELMPISSDGKTTYKPEARYAINMTRSYSLAGTVLGGAVIHMRVTSKALGADNKPIAEKVFDLPIEIVSKKETISSVEAFNKMLGMEAARGVDLKIREVNEVTVGKRPTQQGNIGSEGIENVVGLMDDVKASSEEVSEKYEKSVKKAVDEAPAALGILDRNADTIRENFVKAGLSEGDANAQIEKARSALRNVKKSFIFFEPVVMDEEVYLLGYADGDTGGLGVTIIDYLAALDARKVDGIDNRLAEYLLHEALEKIDLPGVNKHQWLVNLVTGIMRKGIEPNAEGNIVPRDTPLGKALRNFINAMARVQNGKFDEMALPDLEIVEDMYRGGTLSPEKMSDIMITSRINGIMGGRMVKDLRKGVGQRWQFFQVSDAALIADGAKLQNLQRNIERTFQNKFGEDVHVRLFIDEDDLARQLAQAVGQDVFRAGAQSQVMIYADKAGYAAAQKVGKEALPTPDQKDKFVGVIAYDMAELTDDQRWASLTGLVAAGLGIMSIRQEAKTATPERKIQLQNGVLSFMERMMTVDSFGKLGELLAAKNNDLNAVLAEMLTKGADALVWQVKPVNVNEIRDYVEAELETLRSL